MLTTMGFLPFLSAHTLVVERQLPVFWSLENMYSGVSKFIQICYNTWPFNQNKYKVVCSKDNEN